MNYEHFNWGIIGPGRIAHRFAEALVELDDGCLYAVASRNEERGKNFAKKFFAEKVYTIVNSLKIKISTPSILRLHIIFTLNKPCFVSRQANQCFVKSPSQ